MSDAVFQALVEQLHQCNESALWLADESNGGVLDALSRAHAPVQLLTNRIDIATAAESRGIATVFADFDFAALPPGNKSSITRMYYRVSKERPLTNHVINRAFEFLPLGGSLWLAGEKNEGIKTYFTQASRLFGSTGTLKKYGSAYCGQIQKKVDAAPLLDDQNYSQLRWVEGIDQVGFYSKPGTYGWNKVDKGSAFLIEQLPTLLHNKNPEMSRFLDLGCGYGYLMLSCRSIPFQSFTGTDNNAAAVLCARANAAHYQLHADIVADDCGKNLPGSFDFILCNPPFHQGFSVENALTSKFLSAVKRLLAPGGCAGLVVNSFIPLEAKASQLLPAPDYRTEMIANNSRFKVVQISRRAPANTDR